MDGKLIEKEKREEKERGGQQKGKTIRHCKPVEDLQLKIVTF